MYAPINYIPLECGCSAHYSRTDTSLKFVEYYRITYFTIFPSDIGGVILKPREGQNSPSML